MTKPPKSELTKNERRYRWYLVNDKTVPAWSYLDTKEATKGRALKGAADTDGDSVKIPEGKHPLPRGAHISPQRRPEVVEGL